MLGPTARSTWRRSRRIASRIFGRSRRDILTAPFQSSLAGHDSASPRDVESDPQVGRPFAEGHPPTVQRLEEDHCRPRGGGQQQRLFEKCSLSRRRLDEGCTSRRRSDG